MIEMMQQILNITLFDKTVQPFAVLPKDAVETPNALLSDNCHLELSSKSATNYLTTLEELLDTQQPDSLFLVPPFIAAEALPQKIKDKHPDLDLPDIALKVALGKIPAGCRLGILMPRGFLLNTHSQPLREQINQTTPPRFVIDFDAGQIISYDLTETSLHLIVIHTGETGDQLVHFFRCPNIPPLITADGHDEVDATRQQAVQKDLKRLIKQGGGTTEFGYVLREGLPAEVPWLFARHHPSYQERIDDLGYFGQVRTMGDLVEMWFGFRPTEQVNLLIPGQETRKGIPVIEARDIDQNTITSDDPRYRILPEKSKAFQLQPNDICLRADMGQNKILRAVKIEKEMLPLVVANSVLVLRPKPEVNLDVSFLVAYLQSNHIVEHLRAQGIATRLYPAALQDVPVPVQDEELQTALNDIRNATRSLNDWQAEAQAALQTMFNFKSAQEARAYVLAVGRRIRQRQRAAQQIDDLSYRLRTGFPHPLAYRWRMAETVQPTLDGYRDVLECAETAICYLALVALVMMRAVKEPVKYLDTISQRLTQIGHGTNFGDWVAILREVQGNKSLKQMKTVPFYEIARFLDEENVDQALVLLTQNRNDNAHGRGPHGPEIPEKIDESQLALQTLLEATEFLAEFPLRYIEDVQRDSIAGVTTYHYRNLMGDHSIIGVEEAQTDMVELEAHSLYLMNRSGELHLMRPFLTRQECPDCKTWELFYLDTYSAREGTCTLKSMTTNHTLIDSQFPDVFRHVGMLM